jgi:Ca2+-binding EF-hand superfamily protein
MDEGEREAIAAAGLSEEQLDRLREIFDRHDVDGSGEIDVSALEIA